MALPDFFSFYGLPQTFRPDPALVRRQYYALSREHHPDRYAGSDDIKIAETLQMSALNNEAYRTLSDADATFGYILRLHQIIEEEESYKLPPEFLMEMMELNEAVDEGGEEAKLSYDAALEAWEASVAPLKARFDAGEREESLFARLKDAYYRKKYLHRLGERL